MPTDEELAKAIESLNRWDISGRRVTVHLVTDQAEAPLEVWATSLQQGVSGSSLPLDLMAELKFALEAGGAPPPYHLDVRRGYTSWGASGVTEDVLLVVAGWTLNGLVGGAAYDALRSALVRLTRKARDEQEWGPHMALTSAEAEERGRWALSNAFHLSSDELDRLVVTGAEESADGGKIVRYLLDDKRYEVELLEDEGLVTIARIGWEFEEWCRQ